MQGEKNENGGAEISDLKAGGDLKELLSRIYEEREAARKRDTKGVKLGKEYIRATLLSQITDKEARSISDIRLDAEGLELPKDRTAYQNYERLAEVLIEARNLLLGFSKGVEAKYYQLLAALTGEELAKSNGSGEILSLARNAALLGGSNGGFIALNNKLKGELRDANTIKIIVDLLAMHFWRGEELFLVGSDKVKLSFFVNMYNRLVKATEGKYLLLPIVKEDYEPSQKAVEDLSKYLGALDISKPIYLNLGRLYYTLTERGRFTLSEEGK